jgi:hypothetical protein
LDKEIFEKQFKSKKEIRKSANGGLQLNTVGKSTERRTQRDKELAKCLSGLGENRRASFRSKNEIEQSEP